jgi:hypothetical protein
MMGNLTRRQFGRVAAAGAQRSRCARDLLVGYVTVGNRAARQQRRKTASFDLFPDIRSTFDTTGVQPVAFISSFRHNATDQRLAFGPGDRDTTDGTRTCLAYGRHAFET